jgi:hypothetical protein
LESTCCDHDKYNYLIRAKWSTECPSGHCKSHIWSSLCVLIYSATWELVVQKSVSYTRVYVNYLSSYFLLQWVWLICLSQWTATSGRRKVSLVENHLDPIVGCTGFIKSIGLRQEQHVWHPRSAISSSFVVIGR